MFQGKSEAGADDSLTKQKVKKTVIIVKTQLCMN